jgi:Carboxypeptidase regulatory-like domain
VTLATAARVVTVLSVLAMAQQRPARDAVPPAPTHGTASISGIVVNDEPTPQPVRRAIVRVTGPDLHPSRGAITDDEGRFTIGDLPAGRITLAVSRASFITSAYGSKRPGRAGTPIALADGERRGGLVVRLWRGAVVTGVVRDEAGAPVGGVPVSAKLLRGTPTESLLTLTNNGTETDDRGEYRIFGLVPGSYVIAARPRPSGLAPMIALADAEVDAALEALRHRTRTGTAVNAPSGTEAAESPKPFDYAPVYYPGGVTRAQAAPVALTPGQEASGLDITLRRVSTATVAGTLFRLDGGSVADAAVQLTLGDAVATASDPADAVDPINTTTRPDGSFVFSRVAPGDYTLTARVLATPAPPSTTPGFASLRAQGPRLWAMTTLAVNGVDLSGVTLTLQPPMTVSGRLRFDGDGQAPGDLSQVFVGLRPARGVLSSRSLGSAPPAPSQADGTFSVTDLVPGRYVMTIAGRLLAERDWWPVSAMVDGRDVLDEGLDIAPGVSIPDLEIILTDRHTELGGTLQTADGRPVADVFIVVYSTNRHWWGPASRRVQIRRPGIDGQYVLKDLPPGEYYLAAALDADQEDLEDPAFLEQLVPGSLRLTLAAGEKKTQDLRVGG